MVGEVSAGFSGLLVFLRLNALLCGPTFVSPKRDKQSELFLQTSTMKQLTKP